MVYSIPCSDRSLVCGPTLACYVYIPSFYMDLEYILFSCVYLNRKRYASLTINLGLILLHRLISNKDACIDVSQEYKLIPDSKNDNLCIKCQSKLTVRKASNRPIGFRFICKTCKTTTAESKSNAKMKEKAKAS